MSTGYVGDWYRRPRPKSPRAAREGRGLREGIRWVFNRCEVCERAWRDVAHRNRCNAHPARLFVPAVCECGVAYFRLTSEPAVYASCPQCRSYPSTAGNPRVVRLRNGRRGSGWYLWRDGELSFDDVVRAWEERFDE